MIVTLFKNIHSTSTPYHVKIDEMLSRIKDGASKSKVEEIRKIDSKKDRNELKKKLPCICFSGIFRERKADKIIKHTGLICLDFDEFKTKKELYDAKSVICDDVYTYSCFISPSGQGLKVLVKIPAEAHNHKKYFEALQNYYKTTHLDASGSDVSRVCYESHDPFIFVNKDSFLFDKILDTKQYDIHDVQNIKIPIKQESIIIKRLDKWWDKNYGFEKGKRNENVFVLGCAFSKFGISQYSCEQHFSKFTRNDFSFIEIKRTVQSAYQKTKPEFKTKYFEDTQITEHIMRRLLSGENEGVVVKELKQKGYAKQEIEATLEEAKKNESVEVFWHTSKTGKITIINRKLKEFLKQKGFFKYYPEGSENFVFVKIESNLIENINEDKIKTFVLDELIKNGHFDVFEYLATATKYFRDDYLNILEPVKVTMNPDTKNASYCYYRNCAVKVTADNINIINYISLDGYVWKDRVIDRDFKITSDFDNDFKTFIFNISGKNEKNKKAFETTLGYLMSSYKSKGYAPSIILNDEVISENPEGGTGKGLLVCAIAQLKKCVIIDGKCFDKNKAFAYQTVSVSTQVLVFDDVKKNLDFEGLFSLVTEGITLEKKNKDAVKLDFYSSPKIVITTNYAIPGKGNSNDRRRWELELSQYYNSKKTPLDEFDKLLFDDWNKEEWLRFDNYMLSCLQKYIKNGFAKAEFKNLPIRKFINETCLEFYEWTEDSYLIQTDRISKNDLFVDFTNNYTDYRKWLSKKKFNTWLKSWAKFKEIKYEEGNSNGIRWITFFVKNKKIEAVLDEVEF